MSLSDDNLYIGLMSGTSLDGVDGVLASFPESSPGSYSRPLSLATAYVAFPAELRADLMSLQSAGTDEIHREALAANALVRCYAQCVSQLLAASDISPAAVQGIGAHGQTIRHRPEAGYTRQINNPALLAELSGIDVIADFRSRDIAAGGQGAPLVPAFHQAVFGSGEENRVVVNIGGISNISILNRDQAAGVTGFDTGLGNVLMDAWIAQHRQQAYDADGAWASGGNVIPDLLSDMVSDPFFALAPPKSTGRDLFHPAWLNEKLAAFSNVSPADVQATLAEFTATTIADAIHDYAPQAQAVYVCGGGAYNAFLMKRLHNALRSKNGNVTLQPTDALGISANHVEALAFAWLACRFTGRQPGNLASVTGAKGPRILGALYPA